MMPSRTLWDGGSIPALGLGCWAIGGPFFAGETPLGWGEVDDRQSNAAIRRAVELGIRFFDTAQAYGAGHSETVLGEALHDQPGVRIGTKIGLGFDARTKQVTGQDVAAASIEASIDQSLKRLRRERIDIVHLHLNAMPISEAEPVFDILGRLRENGKIAAFGWSTDYPDRAEAFANRDGFAAVQHAMNVFFRADTLMPVIERNNALSINRSPLAMGVLTGKFADRPGFQATDIRSQTLDWMAYFQDGAVKPYYVAQLDAVRELLCRGNRTLAQGALAWLWARSPNTLPIPGFRTVAQVEELASALEKGALDPETMAEIEAVIVREPEGEPRDR
jgi:aryl-alcohol dehydrogenase-like predicted oxidoreductase